MKWVRAYIFISASSSSSSCSASCGPYIKWILHPENGQLNTVVRKEREGKPFTGFCFDVQATLLIAVELLVKMLPYS
jgi:hypothetical protein